MCSPFARSASNAPRISRAERFGSCDSMIAEITATPVAPWRAISPARLAVMPPIANTGRRDREMTSSSTAKERTGSSGFVGLGKKGPTAK